MLHKSRLPEIICPEDITVWAWLFQSSSFQKLQDSAPTDIKGVTNTVSGERITYTELKDYAEHLSMALVRNCGLQPGDTVVLLSENSIWFPVAMFAVLRAGARVAGASPASTVDEMSYYLRVCRAKFVMTAPNSANIAVAAAQNVGIGRDRIFSLYGVYERLVGIHHLIQVGAQIKESSYVEAYLIPAGKGNRDICGYLSFTSGTMGRPKACMISHHNVIAQCLQMGQVTCSDYEKALAILPLYHSEFLHLSWYATGHALGTHWARTNLNTEVTGLVNLLHLPIFRQAEILLLPKFTMEAMLDAIARYELVEVLMVPAILNRLARDPLVSRYGLSSIRRFVSGAAPLPAETLRLLQEKFPNTGFKQGWGMTETCCCVTATDPAHYDFKYAETTGVILANTEIKFIDEAGVESEEGEILVRGPQCTMGYLNAPEETQNTFLPGGWLRTGDIGRMDGEGCLTIRGRNKDLIKVKGVGVSPAELEDVLMDHPKVQDVGVVGVPDTYSGEGPHAFVVLHADVDPSPQLAEELVQYVRDRRARPKWVKEVSFVKEIPRAGSGKLLRRQLQASIGMHVSKM